MVLLCNPSKEPSPYTIGFNSFTTIKLPPELKRYDGDPGYRYMESVCGKDVKFGDYVTIHAPIKVGDNVTVGNNVVIREGCTIGSNVTIDDGCIIPPKTHIDDGKHWTLEDTYKEQFR